MKTSEPTTRDVAALARELAEHYAPRAVRPEGIAEDGRTLYAHGALLADL